MTTETSEESTEEDRGRARRWRSRSNHDVRTFVGYWKTIPCFCWADAQHNVGDEVRTRAPVLPAGQSGDTDG